MANKRKSFWDGRKIGNVEFQEESAGFHVKNFGNDHLDKETPVLGGRNGDLLIVLLLAVIMATVVMLAPPAQYVKLEEDTAFYDDANCTKVVCILKEGEGLRIIKNEGGGVIEVEFNGNDIGYIKNANLVSIDKQIWRSDVPNNMMKGDSNY